MFVRFYLREAFGVGRMRPRGSNYTQNNGLINHIFPRADHCQFAAPNTGKLIPVADIADAESHIVLTYSLGLQVDASCILFSLRT